MLNKDDIQFFSKMMEQRQQLNIHQQMDFLVNLAAPLLDRNPRLPFRTIALNHKLIEATSRALKRPLNQFWVQDDKMWLWSKPIRDVLRASLNETVSFLLGWKDPRAPEYLTQCSELAEVIPVSHNAPSTALSLDNFIDWWRSEHQALLGIHRETYLHEMDLSHYGKFLPRLIMFTELRANEVYYNQHLTLQSMNIKRPMATAAIIQHLKYGDDIPFETVMEVLGPEHPTNTYRPHWHWIADYHAFAGIADRSRTAAFFDRYCRHLVTTDCEETKKQLDKMVTRLNCMTEDRELTYNHHSKRYFLDFDMALHI
jgi:hypothetical protein